MSATKRKRRPHCGDGWQTGNIVPDFVGITQEEMAAFGSGLDEMLAEFRRETERTDAEIRRLFVTDEDGEGGAA